MTEQVSRRLFLGGAIALSSATILPASAMYAATLYGDGVTDDVDALEALFAGKHVRILRDDIVVKRSGGGIYFNGGTFAISRTLRIGSNIRMENLLLFYTKDFDKTSVADCQFVGENTSIRYLTVSGFPQKYDALIA